MKYNFIKFGATSSLELDETREDYFFFEQNREKFSQIFEFLSGHKHCFVLSGFQGVGKSKIINEAISYLNDNVLLFKYRMYEATTLDDILMNLMIDFREFQKSNRTILPKIDTKDFSERIKYYVKNIEKPMLLVLESYSDVLKNEEIASGINEFLFHLTATNKFKIIFVSRTFDTTLLSAHNIDFEQMIISSANEDGLKNYLTLNKIKASPNSMKKLFDASHCYLKYIDMTIRLLHTYNISLDELMAEHDSKKINFSTFIINKFLSLAPERSKELIYLLSFIRQGVTETFLTNADSQNATLLPYLKNIKILNEDNKKNLYIKDYFKKEIIKEIDQFTTQKLHRFLADTYSNMLPKKPFERELPISRSTMRRERDYHASFISNYTPPNAFSAYAQSSEPTLAIYVETENQNEAHTPTTSPIAEIDYFSQKNISEVAKQKTIEEIIKLAQDRESNFDYQTAIFYYQSSLEKQDEQDYAQKRSELLEKIAKCYSKLRKPQNAIKCFELAYESYNHKDNKQKSQEMLLGIASEYKNDYKFLVSKTYLEKIINEQENASPQILTQTYSLLADMEDLSSNIIGAKNLYQKALQYSLQTNNNELISTAYFKYGLLLDDTNQQSMAVECYQKSIETCDNPETNTYLSSAYSNLAGIYFENNDKKKALEFYHKALEADQTTHNYEGLYFVYTKIAELYESTDFQTCYKYLTKALNAAKNSNDKICIASSHIEIGDIYYKQKNLIKALKSYLCAKHILSTDASKENDMKISTRIKELKIKLSEDTYSKILKNFKYENEI